MYLSYVSSAQQCAEFGLTPKDGPDGYSHRQKDDRCEGIFRKKISGKSLDLLLFTKGQFQFQSSNSEEITLTSVDPKLNASGKGRGVNFGMRESYRLDFTLSKGPVVVPTKTILAPYQITDRTMGVFGYVETDGETHYFPLKVSSKMNKNIVRDEQTYFIKFIPNAIVAEAQWRFASSDAAGCGEFSEFILVDGGGFGPQVPFTISLPKGMPDRNVCLEIKFKGSNGEWSSRTFNLIVP